MASVGENAVWGAEGGSWHAVGLSFPCLQEASAGVAILRTESMFRVGTGMKVARALLLLGLGWLTSPSDATAQTCTDSKVVAIVASCAFLVSKRTPWFLSPENVM